MLPGLLWETYHHMAALRRGPAGTFVIQGRCPRPPMVCPLMSPVTDPTQKFNEPGPATGRYVPPLHALLLVHRALAEHRNRIFALRDPITGACHTSAGRRGSLRAKRRPVQQAVATAAFSDMEGMCPKVLWGIPSRVPPAVRTGWSLSRLGFCIGF